MDGLLVAPSLRKLSWLNILNQAIHPSCIQDDKSIIEFRVFFIIQVFVVKRCAMQQCSRKVRTFNFYFSKTGCFTSFQIHTKLRKFTQLSFFPSSYSGFQHNLPGSYAASIFRCTVFLRESDQTNIFTLYILIFFSINNN